ncbi:MAG: branched-chain amino acid ABC transporter permease [Alphaproteobacteria bacterium]
MNMPVIDKALGLHLGVIAALIALQFILPAYHHGVLARVMVLAVFALGYNIAFGYTGLLSLGHALFFCAGMYGTGLAMRVLEWTALGGFFAGIVAAAIVALVVGLLALRTTGVAFMIVTLMFAQAGYLTILYFNQFTRGDEGFVIAQAARSLGPIDFTQMSTRYFLALSLFAICLMVKFFLVRSPTGRVLVAIRENEERAKMLGYNPFRYKLLALVASGVFAGAAGAMYALLFGYVGATFATIQYSIFPLLWVLLGGAGVVLGPLLGTLFMFYLVDLTSGITDAYMLGVGVVLVLLVLWMPKGILGSLRERYVPWLP